jgi:hypothetical protein
VRDVSRDAGELFAHERQSRLQPLAVGRVVEPAARSRRVRERHGHRLAERKARPDAIGEARGPEQPARGQASDDEDEPRA